MLRISSVIFNNHEIRYNAAEVIIKPGYMVPTKLIFKILTIRLEIRSFMLNAVL